jgi:hypothetical protein
MDYKIKLEYKGPGKQAGGSAASARKQAIQASQKAAEKKPGSGGPEVNKDLINSIKKLIESNKSLEKNIFSESKTDE